MISRKMWITIAGALLVAGLLIWWHYSDGIIGHYHPNAASDTVESGKP